MTGRTEGRAAGVVEGALRRLVPRREKRGGGEAGAGTPLRLSPSSGFEALLEERVRGLRREVREVRGRVNGLIFLVLGVVVVQTLLRLLQ